MLTDVYSDHITRTVVLTAEHRCFAAFIQPKQVDSFCLLRFLCSAYKSLHTSSSFHILNEDTRNLFHAELTM